MIFLTFFIIPLLIGFFAWIFTDKISWLEVTVQLLIQFVFIGIMSYLMLQNNMSDLEVWNGNVVEKWNAKVSCRHSYRCHCYTTCSMSCSGSGKSRSCRQVCTEHCSTCYEHSYDKEWYVKNNLKETWEIATSDRQGLNEPSNWSSVRLGEPTSTLHAYENYIKGSPDSLFHRTTFTEEEVKTLPAYPLKIYDYWKLNRVVLIDCSLPEIKKWNESLAQLSGELGQQKQVNLVLVIVRNKPQDFFYTLERFWLGGKKNDVIIVIGVNDVKIVQWAEIMSLSNEEFKIYLRNDLITLSYLDLDKILKVVKKNVLKHYARRPMKDFVYLKEAIKPTKKQWIFGLIFGLILSISLSVFFYYQDPFGDVTKSKLRKKILGR